MKKAATVFLFFFMLYSALTAFAVGEDLSVSRSEKSAIDRAKEYARAVNYEFRTPGKIYDFLWSGFKEIMDEESFIKAFNKERSYPYITPLYIFSPEVTEKTETGGFIITFLQAARIVGMTYDIEMVYENGNWFVKDWEQFPDGSYLEKFEKIPYSLDWYYDLSEINSGG